MSGFQDTGPVTDAASVTPDDDAGLGAVPRALWIGGAGNISVVMVEGTTVVFEGIVAGTLLPIRVKQVRSTDTTASAILALY